MGDDIAALQARQLVREAITTFIRTLLRGICIEVLMDDGSVLFPEVSLNYELTHLLLDINGTQRPILLADAQFAAAGEFAVEDFMSGMRAHLDERCCTLIIKDVEFVTFRFDTARLCDYFAACLRVLMSQCPEVEEAYPTLVGVTSSPPSRSVGPLQKLQRLQAPHAASVPPGPSERLR